MNIAGLDIATVTGLAMMDDLRLIKTQTFRPKIKDAFLDAGGTLNPNKEGVIGRQFEDFFHLYLIKNKIEHVAIEAPITSAPVRRKVTHDPDAMFAGQAKKVEYSGAANMNNIFRAWGMEMIACTVCARLNIPVEFVAQGTWRKEFLGNGSPTDAKDRAVRQCQKLNIEISSKDAAEAAGVLVWLDRKLNPHSASRAEDLFNLPK